MTTAERPSTSLIGRQADGLSVEMDVVATWWTSSLSHTVAYNNNNNLDTNVRAKNIMIMEIVVLSKQFKCD